MKYTEEMFKGGPNAPTIADVEGHPGVVMLVGVDGEVMVTNTSVLEELVGDDVEHLRYVGTVPPL